MGTIYSDRDYLWNQISRMLANGQKVDLPKQIIEQEGITLDELNEYFHTQNGSFGLVHFLGFRRAI